jgi:hypothetical protein
MSAAAARVKPLSHFPLGSSGMTLAPGRIRHTVVFTPRHPAGSPEETDFLDSAARLAAIPGVEELELLHETSPKNGYRFGLSMEFADAAAYTAYNEHPDHVRFVQERWLVEVEDFLEIDYESRAC